MPRPKKEIVRFGKNLCVEDILLGPLDGLTAF